MNSKKNAGAVKVQRAGDFVIVTGKSAAEVKKALQPSKRRARACEGTRKAVKLYGMIERFFKNDGKFFKRTPRKKAAKKRKK